MQFRLPFARGQRGQGLVEYLVIVSLMAIASIAVVRALSEVVQSRFKTVAAGLQGDKKARAVRLDDNLAKRKDMGNFFDGVDGGSGASAEH
jgi:Flp pilus assembly pilin Flp